MNLVSTSVTSVSSVVNSSGGPFTTEDTEKPSFHSLASTDVHIWRVPLNQSSAPMQRLLKFLSPDERERAARFHFDKDRNQFVQARATLRFILSEYLNVEPRTLEFSYGSQGKPALANGHGDSDLRFNLSRRAGLALIAVTRGREIGVDVELVRADLPVLDIAATSFSEGELATLRSLPESLRVAGFYNCWTRKEAYVKARGQGLSFPLKQFDVSLTPGDSAKLLSVRDDLDETDRWNLREIPVAENYVAAFVVEGSNLSVTCRDWDPSSVISVHPYYSKATQRIPWRRCPHSGAVARP